MFQRKKSSRRRFNAIMQFAVSGRQLAAWSKSTSRNNRIAIRWQMHMFRVCCGSTKIQIPASIAGRSDSRQEPNTPLAHPLQKRRFFRGAKVDNAKSIAIRVLFCFMRAPCAHHCCSCLRRESSRHGVTGNYGLPAKPAPSCTCVSPEYQPCSGSGWRDP